eukprot:COSAG02_NODE_812_length_16908_cov_238.494319_12_plen_1820_part_00
MLMVLGLYQLGKIPKKAGSPRRQPVSAASPKVKSESAKKASGGGAKKKPTAKRKPVKNAAAGAKKSSGAKKKPAKTASKKTTPAAKPKKKTPAKKATPAKKKQKTSPGPASAGYSHFVAEYGNTLKQVDANTLETGGGQAHVLATMWDGLEPEARAQYEKLGLTTRIEKLARINFMKSASPRAQKGGAANARDMQQALDDLWTKLPATEREPHLAAARREEFSQAAFKIFASQYPDALDEVALGVVETGGGEEHVLRTMWQQLDQSQQDAFVTEAMKQAEQAAVDSAMLPTKKKRKLRTPGSKSKPLSLSKQYLNAACEACAALKERNGSTVGGITNWLKSEKPELNNEEMIKKAVKIAVRHKKLEKKGVRYKVTKEWRKSQQDETKKQRDAERAEEKKLKEEERKKLAEEQKLQREKLQQEQAAIKETQKKLETAERERKAALKLNKYPVDDLQALSEVALCDPENMMFYPVAEAHRQTVKDLDDKRNQLETKDANREKYAEGARVKMLLADVNGEDEWYLGNVVAVADTGLDIAFDDGDFQQDVDFNDEDLHLVVKEQSEKKEASHLVDFPPTISDTDLPPRLQAELMAVSSMLARFHEDVTLPMFSGADIVAIVCDDAGLHDGVSDDEMDRASKALQLQRSELHVQLLHLIGTEDMYSEDFMHVQMNKGMIDAYSWQEVLHRYVLSVLHDNNLEVNRPVVQAAESLKQRGYGGLTVEDRVHLLCFLCAEALEGPAIRDVIAEDNEAYDELVKEFEDTEKARKDQIKEKLKKERQQEREKLSEQRSKKNDEKMIAKQEREAKQAAERAEFQAYLKSKNKPVLEDPKDPRWKKEWANWKSWKTQEKKRAENAAKAEAKKAEAERIKAEKKAAKEAEKRSKEEARIAAKEAREKEKEAAKLAKSAAKLAKKSGGKIMGLDITADAPDQTLASMHGMSRGEYMKHMRMQREKAMEEERQKRELAELQKQEEIRKAKEAEKEKLERRKRGLAKFEKMQEQGLGKQTKEEVLREKEEMRLARKQEALDTKLEQHACSLTPLGRDRFLNRYWWTPAYPSRLYVEKMKLPTEFMPPLAQAVRSASGDGSEEQRRAAAARAMEDRLRSLPSDVVRRQLENLGLTPGDQADVCQLAVDQLTQDLKGREPTLVEFANTGKVVAPPSRTTRPRKKKAGDSDQANDQAENGAPEEDDDDLASPKEASEELNADLDDEMDDCEAANTDYWGINRPEEEWGFYDTPHQLDSLLETINPLGKREKKLQASIMRYSERIREAMVTKQGRRARRGTGGSGKKLVEPIALLVSEMRSLADDYIPSTQAIKDKSDWDQALTIAEQYMDVIDPLKQLGAVLCELGTAAENARADKAALVGRQWTEEEDEALSQLCVEEGADDWEGKKERMQSMRSVSAIRMRWESTLQKRVEEELAAQQAAGAAFAIDQVVWAKVQYYPWWPARVSKHPKTGECLGANGKYHVTFFDDDTRGTCSVDQMQSFEGEMQKQLKVTVKKSLQAKRANSIKAAKEYCEAHPDAQVGKGEVVAGNSKKKKSRPKTDSEDTIQEVAPTDAESGDADADKSRSDDDEEDAEGDDIPKNWVEWTAKWSDALDQFPTETAVIFSLYALRDRTGELIPPLKAAAAKKGKKKPSKSPSGKGRRRGGRVNYAEDDEEEDEDEEDEELSVEDLIEAAESGDRARLRKILDAGVSASAANDDGATPLMLAAQEQQKSCLKLLLQRGAKVDQTDADGWSALMFAAKADDAEAIELLCDYRANTEIKDNAYGMTAFLLACENGCPDAVETLAECGCDIKAKDDDGSDGKKLAAAENPPHDVRC